MIHGGGFSWDEMGLQFFALFKKKRPKITKKKGDYLVSFCFLLFP